MTITSKSGLEDWLNASLSNARFELYTAASLNILFPALAYGRCLPRRLAAQPH
jgi:hypothetical protein